MDQQLRTMMYQLWSAACQDKPLRPSVAVEDGHFVMTVAGNRDNWQKLCEAAGVPSHAEQTVDGDRLTVRWPSVADEIFGANGLLAQRLFEYEVRAPQLHMARMVQRSIEMRCPAAIEAGTGTGKSFAYAAVAMAMNKKLVVSTSNKALQMQLYKKDVPFLQELFPGKKVALAVGKTNFACRKKAEDSMAGTIAIDDPALREWYTATDSGNLEELEVWIEPEAVNAIRVDDDCDGKHCPFYASCYYYLAKQQREQADVIVTNHALLCLAQLYPGAGILPEADVVVVDEAHKLPDYARGALGVQFLDTSLRKMVDEHVPLTDQQAVNIALGGDTPVDAWLRPVIDVVAQADERASQVGIDERLELNEQLAIDLEEAADEIWPLGAMPSTALERKEARQADKLRSMADNVRAMCKHKERHVRWVEPDRDKDRMTLVHQPFDVSAFVAKLAGVQATQESQIADHTRCHRCGRQLTAETVAILDGKPYGPDCIRHVDVFGDAERVPLTEWLDADHEPEPQVTTTRATVFASATLATPDMSAFMRECGLPDAMQMVAASPFDYQSNALLYTPNGKTPAPSSREYIDWLIDEMQALVLASQGGAFLLFTSYANMRRAVDGLRQTFQYRGWTVLVQGELPKLEIARRFAADGNAVLFATKSFFEGVSIEGDALRLVCIDKMPFEAPSPLTTAMEADLQRYAREQLGMTGRNAEFYPFTASRLPRMIVELKQGSGRLIRTRRDWGVMAILDSRVRSTRYGRESVLPSLPPAPLARTVDEVEEFFEGKLAKQSNVHQFLTAMAGEGL